MSKRTRKDKENPNYDFLIKWEPSLPKLPQSKIVKGELVNTSFSETDKIYKDKKARSSANPRMSLWNNKDLVKSLIFSSLILCVEIVIYLLKSSGGR